MTQNPSTGRHADPAGQMPPISDEPVPYPGATDVPAPLPDHDTTPTGKHGAPPTVRRSRFGGLWVGLIVAAVILVLLLIFILQNSKSVQIEFMWMSGQAPLAVAILLGVAAGALLVAVPGTVRILQLRKSVRHRV